MITLSSSPCNSAYAFLGAGGFIYQNGIGWWENGIWTVFPGILFWVIGRRFWLLGKTRGYLSMAQYISDVYQTKWLGIIVTAITLVFTVPYVAMQAIGSGYIFQTISGGTLSYSVGTFIFFGIMIVLVWLGGMKGVTWTDAAQGVFMWVGMVVGSYWIITQTFGSLDATYQAIWETMPSLFTLPGPKGTVTPADWVSRWTIITIGMMMFPHITLRFFSGKSLRVLKWSSIFSSIYLTSIYVFLPAVGMAGHILLPGLKASDTVFPELLLQYTPIVFAALIISGALAASISTGDSQLHAVSTMVSTDIYKPYIQKEATDYQQYRVAKMAIIFFGLLSVLVALSRPGILANILALSNGGVAALAPAMLGGIFWKKSTKEAAISSILIGEVVMIVTTFIIKSPLGIMGGLWGLLTALVIFIVVSLCTKPQQTTVDIVTSVNEFFADKPAEQQ